MPPLLAALPLITAAAGAGELGLGIANATKGAPKPAPVTSIPGSPETVVGAAQLPANSVLSQITGSSNPAGGGAKASPIGGGGVGGGGKSASPPAAISGGGGDLSALPWLSGAATSPSISPGTPGAI